jgi:hypothetical protein
MQFFSDLLLAAGAFGAALYCYVLSARLKKFTTLETGMGGAIAVLSAQVDDMTQALAKAQGAASVSVTTLETLTLRAEGASAKLELLVASLHDLPDPHDAASFGPREESDRSKVRFVRRRNPSDDLEAAE